MSTIEESAGTCFPELDLRSEHNQIKLDKESIEK